MSKLVDRAKIAIDNAERELSNLTEPILTLIGMSSPKVRHFLNNIIVPTSRYLEVGCWRGSTFISALFNNNPETAFAVDNWSEFVDENTSNPFPEHPRQIFYDNVKTFIESKNIHIIDEDCFKIKSSNHDIKNINTYLYDGGHCYEAQYNALSYYYDLLDDEFIFIVDDWNFPDVIRGTRDSISNLNLKTLFECEKPADYNGDVVNWWNGLYISVLHK